MPGVSCETKPAQPSVDSGNAGKQATGMFTGDVMYEQAELQLTRTERVLVMRTKVPHACLSFALRGGGDTLTTLVANHSVASEELPLEVDALALLEARHTSLVGADGVAMLTACTLDQAIVTVADAEDEEGPVRVVAVATVGLSNLLRAGDTPGALAPVNTINVMLWASRSMTLTARLEALSIAVEARTLAVVESALPSRRSGRPASGTGTDCLALLSPCPPPGGDVVAARYAGKHTALGSVIGRAVYDTVSAGVVSWEARHGNALRTAMRGHAGHSA